MMASFIIDRGSKLDEFFDMIQCDFNQHHHIVASWRTGKDRTLPQNNFTHSWYGEIARALPEDDALGWRCYCKLHHGVSILRAEDLDFKESYDAVIKPLSYEKKLIAMRHWPVTSLMTRKQLTRYAELVQADFQARGVLLEVRQA